MTTNSSDSLCTAVAIKILLLAAQWLVATEQVKFVRDIVQDQYSLKLESLRV